MYWVELTERTEEMSLSRQVKAGNHLGCDTLMLVKEPPETSHTAVLHDEVEGRDLKGRRVHNILPASQKFTGHRSRRRIFELLHSIFGR